MVGVSPLGTRLHFDRDAVGIELGERCVRVAVTEELIERLGQVVTVGRLADATRVGEEVADGEVVRRAVEGEVRQEVSDAGV